MSPPTREAPRGFTLLELMVVVAVLAVLSLVALPSMRVRLARQSIAESAAVADAAKAQVAAAWARDHAWPADNATASLPPGEQMVGNVVSAVDIEQGVVHVRFGQQAHASIRGHRLSFRPAVVPDAPVVPIAWVCGRAPVPERMTVQGVDRTDLPEDVLPLNCRRR